MKIQKILLLITLTVLIMGNSNSLIFLDKILDKFEWKKRVLLLITNEEDISLIQGVDSFFKKGVCQNESRNIELYKIIGNEISKYNVPQRYLGKKGIWLIGYDGQDKSHSTDISLLKEIYNIIDKMPLRKREMTEQNKKCN